MAVVHFDVNGSRLWLCSYNPRDARTLLYSDWAAGRAKELLAAEAQDIASIHAWLRKLAPQAAEVVDAIEAGAVFDELTPPGVYPLTPGLERFELPAAAHLRSLDNARRHPPVRSH